MESNNYQQSSNNNYSDSLLTGKGAQPTATNVPVAPPMQGSSFDIVYWIVKLFKYWYLLLIGLVLATGVAYILNKGVHPLYKTVTTILIQEDKKSGFGATFGGYSTLSYQNQNNNNQLLIYSSYDLIAKAVTQLNITNELYQKKRFINVNLYKNGPIEIESNFISESAYGMEFEIIGIDSELYEISYRGDDKRPGFKINGEYGKYLQHQLFFVLVNKTNTYVEKYDLYFHFVSKDELIGDYSSRLRFSFVMEGASVMEISLVGSNYQRDIDFLSVLNQEFFADNLARKNESSQKVSDFIEEQLMTIRDSIASAESKLNEYQMKTGIYTQDKTTRAYTELETLVQKKAEIRLQREYLNDLGNYLKRNNNEMLVTPSAMGVTDAQVVNLVERYNEVSFQLKTLKPENPIYRRHTMLIEDTRIALDQAVQTMLRTLRIEERSVEERYNKIVAEMTSLPERERELLARERDFKINDSYNTYLLQRRIESQIQTASNAPDNVILNQPRMISIVNGSEIPNTYILLISACLAIFIIYVVFKELIFNFAIQSRDEIEKLGLSVLGTIEHTDKKSQMLVKAFPKSGFAEGFRNLRSRMEYVAKKETPISMLLTSTEPKDGKTFIACNLATIYQLTGRKTIIVDCDLRRPAMSKILDVGNEKGLSNYLIGQVKLEEIIVTHPDYEFDVIPAGTIPPNPSELIRSEKTLEMISRLNQMYDYIILDCSPVGLVSDAHFLSRHVDVLLYVVRNEKTNKNFLRYTVNELKDDNITNLVIVYNDVNLRTGYSGYGNKRYYGRSSYYVKHDSYYLNDYLES